MRIFFLIQISNYELNGPTYILYETFVYIGYHEPQFVAVSNADLAVLMEASKNETKNTTPSINWDIYHVAVVPVPELCCYGPETQCK